MTTHPGTAGAEAPIRPGAAGVSETADKPGGGDFWALLVGIDRYAAVTPLRGCVADAQAMRAFLTQQLDVPDDHVRVLADEQATRRNILDTFQQFLIDNPAIRSGDQILFHYSGHGSQMRDATGAEPDGLDETLVAQDSRQPGVFDIPDRTLAALLERLAARKGRNVTVILDSCHSGSATRKIAGPGVALARRAPADHRLPPADLDAGLLAQAPGATRGARSVGPSGWAAAGFPYVLLAGCRDTEESNEYFARGAEADGQPGQPVEADRPDGPAGQGAWHGALTYFTLRALRERTGPETTYADLHEWVAAQVSGIYPTQSPQCEGDRTRTVFGGRRVQRDPFVVVEKVEGDVVTLGAGAILGLSPGTRLALYPPEVRTRADLPPLLATAEVISCTATRARARVSAPGGPARPVTVVVPERARALVTQQAYSGARQLVALEVGDAPGSPRGAVAAGAAGAAEASQGQAAIERLREAVLRGGPGGTPSPYLELAPAGGAADLRVVAAGGQWRIYGADGALLVQPEDVDASGTSDAAAVLHALEAIARYRAVLALANNEPGSTLAGKVRLRLRRYVEDAQGGRAEDLLPGALGPGGDLALEYHPDSPALNRYVVDVENGSPLTIYPHVFTLSPDYSINRLYPALGQQEGLRPGGRFTIGLDAPQERLEVYLPDGWDASRDHVKAIASTARADLEALAQRGLNVPPPARAARRGTASALEQLLDAVAYGAGTRHTRPSHPSAKEEWSVAELPITTVRVSRQATLAAAPVEERVALDGGLTLVKPSGFAGSVAVTTLGLATRGAAGDPALRPPPGLAQRPDLYAPLEAISSTRSVGATALVLNLEVDEAARQAISPQNPLRLEIPAVPGEQVADLLPVIFDGEDYLLAGYAPAPTAAPAAPATSASPASAARSTESASPSGQAGSAAPAAVHVVEVVSLPPALAAPPTGPSSVAAPGAALPAGPQGLPTTRGIGRTLRLFIYKKLGRPTTLTGLRAAEPGPVQPEYREVRKDQFRPGQRVAVLVHGFNSDSGWMVQGIARSLRDAGIAYDHLLAWDYESFGTGVAESAALLAGALREQCGFDHDDGIAVDVIAHSMGCVVARCLVERSGGHAFVDRVVLAGPPNRGTVLATLGRGLVYLTSVLLNRFTLIPPLAAINWLARQLYSQSAGLADLGVDSPLLAEINALAEPANVPYLVLAGENLLDENARARLERLARKTLDRSLDSLFGEQNDIAIGLTSMRQVRGGAYPRLTVQVLPCDHFSYFAIPQGVETIRRWLAGS
jgi:hypothetical protein